ncbi:MAG: nucleoid-structuring protein H-NS [Verrucomicrobia bacterium]|nr:nucleoid-structuring protein H-NS [Verrucomicrobiota bacterium]
MRQNDGNDTSSARWITYRPEIKIVDCTIRDGGLINDHNFEDGFVKSVYTACAAAGVDYIEMGYKASRNIFAPTQFGKWKYCSEDDLRSIVGEGPREIKITVMADAERTDYQTDILPKDKSVIDCIRVAAYIHQIPVALDMIKDAHDKGYETVLQLMAVSAVRQQDIVEALLIAARSPVDAISVVDSFGSLYSEQVRDLTKLYLDVVKGTGKEIGFHAHNNLQLAFANTVEAIVAGANRLDATISGIGRGAGNCPMELLISFLHNPKFRVRPVLECCRDVFVPLSKKMEWGYRIPYAITAHFNMHPRSAIEVLATDKRDDYVAFYDEVIEQES